MMRRRIKYLLVWIPIIGWFLMAKYTNVFHYRTDHYAGYFWPTYQGLWTLLLLVFIIETTYNTL